jgi:hypothetical protein
MKKIVLATAIFTAVAVLPVAVEAGDLTSNRTKNREPISECISTNKKLDVLFVVDQSLSLKRLRENNKQVPGNDPKDERVTALKAVLNVLRTKVNQSDEQLRVDIKVAHSGFGKDFNLHQDWITLDDDGFEEVSEKIDKQADLDNENFTRYHRALSGAVKTFEKLPEDSESCRMMIWFSDGQHDDNNSGKTFSKSEKKQIEDQICGSDGLADQLRSSGVFVVAAGLSPNKGELDLMNLVSEDKGLVKSLSLSHCGTLPAYGKFEVAENSDSLVETLFNLVNTNPGGNDISPTDGQPCADGTPNCSEITFEVTDQVDAFTMLIDRGAPTVEVGLTTGPGQKHVLFGANGIKDANARAERISSNKLFLDVQRRKSGTINGSWTIRFTGAGNESARALVKFLGTSDVKLLSEKGDGNQVELVSLDRYETTGIRVVSSISTSGVSTEEVDVLLQADSSMTEMLEIPLLAEVQPNGDLVVPAQFLNNLLKQDSLRKVTQAKITVRIKGEIVGLIDSSTQQNVLVEFPDVTKKIFITNGKQWPTYMGQDGPLTEVIGTDKQKISFRFRGADGRDSLVKFDELLDENLGLVFISGQECEIPQNRETVCQLELKPAEESYGEKTFIATATFASVDNPSETEIVEIPVDVAMRKATDPCRGIKYAVLLLIAFAAIQAIQRFFFAWLISRFARLNPVDRRARIDVLVSDDGGVLSGEGSRLIVKPGDDSFVFENSEQHSSFILFGYTFSSSALRTFFRSTSTPSGIVTQPGKFVFGSGGIVRNRKTNSTSGVVSLTLRKQWIIGIDEAAMLELANGKRRVPGELIVYLDPYEKDSRDNQLSELTSELSAGRWTEDFATVISKVRQEESSDSEFAEQSLTTNSRKPRDPFSDSSSIQDQGSGNLVEETQVKRRWRRKSQNRVAEDSTTMNQSTPKDPPRFRDPFSN